MRSSTCTSESLDGVLIKVSVGIGRNLLEAEEALKAAKAQKGLGLEYNVVTYAGEPMEYEFKISDSAKKYRKLERFMRDKHPDRLDDLESVVKYDPKTGLLNRLGYEIELLKIREKGEESERTIVMFDGDNMKSLNTNYGYELTDRVLSEIGKAIRNQVRQHEERPYDILVNRKHDSGGDEFILDLGCDIRNAEAVAKRFIDAIYDCQRNTTFICDYDGACKTV